MVNFSHGGSKKNKIKKLIQISNLLRDKFYKETMSENKFISLKFFNLLMLKMMNEENLKELIKDKEQLKL